MFGGITHTVGYDGNRTTFGRVLLLLLMMMMMMVLVLMD
jgi:hypothetical protein